MTMLRQTIVFICIFNFLHHSEGIVNIDPEKKQQIDDFINSLIFDCEKHNVVGMNLAVVHQGETLYTTGYGLRDLELPDPVTENTLFSIGSVTKHFTTTLLGQKLKEAGYTWDTTVHDILSDLGTEFYFYDPLRSNLTTLRDIASHSAGILRNDAVWSQNLTREELTSRLRFIPGTIEPRTDFNYNNLMITLLGHITEKLVGVKWEELVLTEIYDKLTMGNSSFNHLLPDEDAEVASLYMMDGETIREVEYSANAALFGEDVSPAGAILSTANDMAKWMKMLLAEGLNEAGEVVFDSDVIFETREPVNAYSSLNPEEDPYLPPRVPVRFEKSTYGLSIGQGSYGGYRFAWHNGGVFGQYSEFQVYPDIEYGFYMSFSGEQADLGIMNPISMYVADVVLDQEPWLNATTACTLPEPFSSSIPPHHLNLDVRPETPPVNDMKFDKILNQQIENLLGRYGNFAYGNVSIVQDDITEEFIAQFDVFQCLLVLKVNNESYSCQGIGDFWFHVFVLDVRFDSSSNPAQYVDILFFDPIATAIRFERDLDQADAPGPRDHWPDCEEVFPENVAKTRFGMKKV